jgi:hypothetical protein
MPPGDVVLLEQMRPGFLAQRIRVWTSWVYARLTKRYRVPFGQQMGIPTATGTNPPSPVTYTGVPSYGSMELVLFFLVGGVLGTAQFAWSIDGGLTKVSTVPSVDVTAGGTGYTGAPTVVLSPPDLSWGVQATANATVGAGAVTAVTIVDAGSGYLAPPTVSFTGGAGSGAAAVAVLAPQQLVSAAIVTIPGTGVAANLPAGTYSTDNVYQSSSPVPDVVLGWIASLVLVDAYQGRGVNPQDPQISLLVDDKTRTLAEVKEAADTKDGLFDLPLNDDPNQASAIFRGGPLGTSDASPYVGFDRARARARAEDAQGYRGGDEWEDDG